MLYQNKSTSSPELLGQLFSFLAINYYAVSRIDINFHILEASSKFGQQSLVMMNYPWDLSLSETEKYFDMNNDDDDDDDHHHHHHHNNNNNNDNV